MTHKIVYQECDRNWSLSPMSNLVGDCAEWEIKEIRDQGSHPLSHLHSCPADSNINNFLIHLHL